jgi:hypothetical protein
MAEISRMHERYAKRVHCTSSSQENSIGMLCSGMENPYRKPAIRTFRGLDVCQKTLEGSVIVTGKLKGIATVLRH